MYFVSICNGFHSIYLVYTAQYDKSRVIPTDFAVECWRHWLDRGIPRFFGMLHMTPLLVSQVVPQN